MLRTFTSNKPVFDKILVANRGEIACRVMKTAKRMGIKTVAVYSDADENSLHVKSADEAVYLGPPPSNQSYLLDDKIIEAALKTGAQAIHPGYGFLSEKESFSNLVTNNGLAFIGPRGDAIRDMGCKIASKKIAKEAGVTTIPGYIGEVHDLDRVIEIAHEIGYPIMIKAAGGGGGKGMRIAWNDEEAREGFRLSKDEAMSAFGDDRILIERYIDNPRHIEIQVLADKYGNCVYVNERECSIQRRNQKVIEEAPSVFLDEKTRKMMGEQACSLSRAVGYDSAGTVEFIVDPKKNFFFLEMNTRLQVEHPVTELTTGLDLVEHMIRVAGGEKLSVTQDDIKIKGWAMESRVYAEDPFRNFLPSIGTLTRYVQPTGEKVRIDTGVVEGSEISMYYDPLISKLCTYGETRLEAIKNMEEALDSYVIEGVGHNIPFLRAILGQERYRTGNLTTKYIAEEWPEGFKGIILNENQKDDLAVFTTAIHILRNKRDTTINNKMNNYEYKFDKFVTEIMEKDYKICVKEIENGFSFNVNGKDIEMTDICWKPEQPIFKAKLNGEKKICQMINILPEGYGMRFFGTMFKVAVRTPQQAELFKHMPEPIVIDYSKYLCAPMPGMIFSITDKKVGDKVAEGEELCVIEAMKMQNMLKAPKDTVIKKIRVKQGENVGVDAILIEYED
ncbi:methylcrotonoyl-coa carboxylase subunit alpha [Anaeramoeba flamelloides]|uniref:propionyl-CoA carboxylase n=1 Tax=Anaeramoeba flamelloides TaxID=1746091 RepID=A0ABQ8YJI4_9EUKA|nr:methylcrotonoyl-coa carboxylase subunit alpha [Anaeramoeba flamelloides]